MTKLGKKIETRNKGFSLLEILLSTALIALITGISIPVYQSFQVKNDLDVASNAIVQSLRRSQSLSRAGEGDTSWGIQVKSGDITLFRGTSYISRNTAYDEIFQIPTSITPSGLGEVVFTKLSGNPQATGDIILSTTINETKTITINEKGMVNY